MAAVTSCENTLYRKIPKISPGADIFQRPFLRGLYSEGLIYGGKIAFTNRLASRKFTVFVLFYFVFEGNFSKCKPPGGLYLEGRFNGGFFASPVLGTYIWRGLYMEGLIFGSLRYVFKVTLRFMVSFFTVTLPVV